MGEEREQEAADRSANSREALFQRTYDWAATTASVATLTALGTIEDVDPVELPEIFGTTLHDHIDLEALNAIVASEGHVNLSFPIYDYLVQIDGEELTTTRQ